MIGSTIPSGFWASKAQNSLPGPEQQGGAEAASCPTVPSANSTGAFGLPQSSSPPPPPPCLLFQTLIDTTCARHCTRAGKKSPGLSKP